MGFTRRLIKKLYLRRIIAYFLIFCVTFNLPASVVMAGPQGAEVVNGQVSIQQNGLNTVIHASDQSIINYSSFDIARPEVVQFIQPGSNASVLNRILSANPTNIDGTLLANGRVFFVNPAGIIIGGGATINVNQFVASGLNISNDSFLNGQYEFVGGGGSVANYGDISAQSVYLLGKQVTNTGNINCPAGYVVMAAGDKVFLGEPGGNVIVEIGSLESQDGIDTQPSLEVVNEGTVQAEGGKIILAAAGDALSRPIMKNVGSLSTSNSNGAAGDISLKADDGLFENSGLIAASGGSDTGGTITIVAGEVINTGTVDVSGSQGGIVAFEASDRLGQFGTVNADGIDGNGGNISLTAENVVALGTDSQTTANAGTDGDGGDVTVYSQDTALFRDGANIEAKGGSDSGDGGFIEVSGLEHIEVFGSVDTSAANGQSGQFLIDPHNITIVDNGSNDGSLIADQWEPTIDNSELDIDILEGYLDTTNVTITTGLTGSPGSQPGDVFFNANRDLESGTNPASPSDNSLTVISNRNIIFQAGSGINFAGGGSVTLQAVDNIEIDSTVFLSGGDFTSMHIESDNTNPGEPGVDFVNKFLSSGQITTLGGDVVIDHLGPVIINAAIDSSGGVGGSIDISGSSITVHDDITAGAGAISFTSDNIDFVTTSIVTTGPVILQPNNVNTTIGIGGAPGTFNLDVAEIASIKDGTSGIIIGRSDGQHDITVNAITFDDPVTIQTPNGGSIAVNGQITGNGNASVTLDGPGATTTLSADIVTAGEDITISDNVVLDEAHNITLNTGANSGGNISITGTTTGTTGGVDENLTLISGTGTTTLNGAVGAGSEIDTLTLQADDAGATGSVVFNGPVTVDTITTYGRGYSVAFNAGGTITTDTSFLNTGGVTLGNDAADSITFNGGLDTTAGNTNIAGTVVTVNTQMDLGVTAMTTNSTLKSGSGAINVTSITDGAGSYTLTLQDDTVASAGTVTFSDNVTISKLDTFGRDYAVLFRGASSTIDTDTTFLNTGGVTLGNDAADSITFTGGLDTTAGNTNIAGTVATMDTHMDLGVTTLTSAANLNAGGGDITFHNTLDGGYNLAVNSNGQTTFGGHVGGTTALSNLTTDTAGNTRINGGLVTTTGDQTYNDPVILASDTTLNGMNVRFIDTLDGSSALTVNANADTRFGGNVGSATPLMTLTTDVGGTTFVSGDMTTNSGIQFGDNVIADGAVDQKIEATSGTLLASSTLTKTGAGNLTLTGGTLVDLEGMVNVQAGDLIITDAVDAESDLQASGLIHLQSTGTLAGNVTATGSDITFEQAVIADGSGTQDFDAGTGTLWAKDTITRTTAGNLTLGGDTDINLDGTVDVDAGDLVIEDNFHAAGDLLASDNIRLNTLSGTGTLDGASAQRIDAEGGQLSAYSSLTKTTAGTLTLGGAAGIDLVGTVDVRNGAIVIEDSFEAAADLQASTDVKLNAAGILDGTVDQKIEATSGTLLASSTLTKTGAGNLTLTGGTLVDLEGMVDVQAGDLIITDIVDAESDLQASGLIHLQSTGTLAGNVTATGSDITFEQAVISDGAGDQDFDAGTGTLWAKDTITRTTAGDLTLGGDTDINLDGTVDVQSGSLVIENSFEAAADLQANTDVILNATGILDGSVDQKIEALSGTLTAGGWLHKTDDGSLYLKADGDISLADYLQADSGGISIISDNGKIFTPGSSNDTLNVSITGSSDHDIDGDGIGFIGVDLRNGGKGAIVIISKEDLNLGANSMLIANGLYDTGVVDDRAAVYFLNSGRDSGQIIDVAVYVASLENNVSIDSQLIQIAPGGTMVIDAYDTVVFGSQFVNSITGSGALGWLEACSRITPTLEDAITTDSLPFADDQTVLESLFGGTYVLRGDSLVEAKVLLGDVEDEEPLPERKPIEAEVASTTLPITPEVTSEVVQVENTIIANDLQWLGEELGLCEGDQQGEDDNQCQEITQAYLAGAFLQASDLRPHQAAAQLRTLAALLHDTEGTRMAALGRVIGEFAQPNLPPSPEQFASISQAFTQHVNDGTHYASAKQWLDALGDYTMLLVSEIGWSSEDSIAFVMSKYGPTVTEAGNIGVIAFIQMHLEGIIG